MTAITLSQPFKVGDKVTWIRQVTRHDSHGTYTKFSTVSGKVLSLRGETALLQGRGGLTLLNVAFLTPAGRPNELTRVVTAARDKEAVAHGA